jgi:hypothetical protein
VFTPEISQMVKGLLGLDNELFYFANDLATLDSTFWKATEHLAKDQGLVQRAADGLGTGDWLFQVRPAYLQVDAEVELQRMAAKYGVNPDNLRAAQRRLQKGGKQPGGLQGGQQVGQQQQGLGADQPSPRAPAVYKGRNRPPGQARYELPDAGMLSNSCGWVGLKAGSVQDLSA